MRKSIGVILVLIFALAIAGCGPKKTRQEEVREKLIGQHIDVVVREIGYPRQQMKAPNGNTVYVYSTSSNVRLPLGKIMVNKQIVNETFIEVDDGGIIVNLVKTSR